MDSKQNSERKQHPNWGPVQTIEHQKPVAGGWGPVQTTKYEKQQSSWGPVQTTPLGKGIATTRYEKIGNAWGPVQTTRYGPPVVWGQTQLEVSENNMALQHQVFDESDEGSGDDEVEENDNGGEGSSSAAATSPEPGAPASSTNGSTEIVEDKFPDGGNDRPKTPENESSTPLPTTPPSPTKGILRPARRTSSPGSVHFSDDTLPPAPGLPENSEASKPVEKADKKSKKKDGKKDKKVEKKADKKSEKKGMEKGQAPSSPPTDPVESEQEEKVEFSQAEEVESTEKPTKSEKEGKAEKAGKSSSKNQKKSAKGGKGKDKGKSKAPVAPVIPGESDAVPSITATDPVVANEAPSLPLETENLENTKDDVELPVGESLPESNGDADSPKSEDSEELNDIAEPLQAKSVEENDIPPTNDDSFEPTPTNHVESIESGGNEEMLDTPLEIDTKPEVADSSDPAPSEMAQESAPPSNETTDTPKVIEESVQNTQPKEDNLDAGEIAAGVTIAAAILLSTDKDEERQTPESSAEEKVDESTPPPAEEEPSPQIETEKASEEPILEPKSVSSDHLGENVDESGPENAHTEDNVKPANGDQPISNEAPIEEVSQSSEKKVEELSGESQDPEEAQEQGEENGTEVEAPGPSEELETVEHSLELTEETKDVEIPLEASSPEVEHNSDESPEQPASDEPIEAPRCVDNTCEENIGEPATETQNNDDTKDIEDSSAEVAEPGPPSDEVGNDNPPPATEEVAKAEESALIADSQTVEDIPQVDEGKEESVTQEALESSEETVQSVKPASDEVVDQANREIASEQTQSRDPQEEPLAESVQDAPEAAQPEESEPVSVQSELSEEDVKVEEPMSTPEQESSLLGSDSAPAPAETGAVTELASEEKVAEVDEKIEDGSDPTMGDALDDPVLDSSPDAVEEIAVPEASQEDTVEIAPLEAESVLEANAEPAVDEEGSLQEKEVQIESIVCPATEEQPPQVDEASNLDEAVVVESEIAPEVSEVESDLQAIASTTQVGGEAEEDSAIPVSEGKEEEPSSETSIEQPPQEGEVEEGSAIPVSEGKEEEPSSETSIEQPPQEGEVEEGSPIPVFEGEKEEKTVESTQEHENLAQVEVPSEAAQIEQESSSQEDAVASEPPPVVEAIEVPICDDILQTEADGLVQEASPDPVQESEAPIEDTQVTEALPKNEQEAIVPEPLPESQEATIAAAAESEKEESHVTEIAGGIAGAATATATAMAALLLSKDNDDEHQTPVSDKAIVDEPEQLENVAEEPASGEPPSPGSNKHRKHRSSRHSKSSSHQSSSREVPIDDGRPPQHRKRRESENSLKAMFFAPPSPKKPSRHDSGYGGGGTSPSKSKHRSDRTPEEQAAHEQRRAARHAAKEKESGSAITDESTEIASFSIPTRKSSTRRHSSSRSDADKKSKLLDMNGESVIKAKFIATEKPHVKETVTRSESKKIPIIDRPRFSLDGERPKHMERNRSSRYHHHHSSSSSRERRERKRREERVRVREEEERQLKKAREETKREMERARVEVAEESRRLQERDNEDRRLRREARRKKREEEDRINEGSQEGSTSGSKGRLVKDPPKRHHSTKEKEKEKDKEKERERERERSKSKGPVKSIWSAAKKVFS